MTSFVSSGSVALSLADLAVIADVRTAYAHVVVYRHPALGRVLVINEEIQHVEKWVPLYHEPLVHLPISFIEAPRSALILGGGSFFAARELLRYRSIERLLMLDHDAELLELIVDKYEHARAVVADPRLEIQHVDAFAAVATLRECFDVIVSDASELLNVAPLPFGVLASRLSSIGICSDVIGEHVFEGNSIRASIKAIPPDLKRVAAPIFVPEFPGVLHVLVMWGRAQNLSAQTDEVSNREQLQWIDCPESNPCTYFDPRFRNYYLHVPKLIRSGIER